MANQEGKGSTNYDAAIVRARLAGMYVLHRLRKLGLNVHMI